MAFHLGALPEASVKKTLLIFYSDPKEGLLAKAVAEKERLMGRLGLPRDATSYVGDKEHADGVIALPGVAKHHLAKIREVYPDVHQASDAQIEDHMAAPVENAEGAQGAQGGTSPGMGEKEAMHRGGGKWYVMRGDEKISGPHDREEAERLAKED